MVVLFNHTGEDEYEKLRQVDPNTLGFEPEYDIDVATATEEYKAVVRALRRAGFRARAVNLEEDLRRLERVLKRNRPDVIFNLVEHFHDDADFEPAVAAMFDLYRVAYTGAPPFALSMCQKKGLTKQILIENDVPTPRFKLLDEPVVPKRFGLQFPLIVKPAREDASTGVEKGSVVRDREELAARLMHVFDEFDPPILVEEFIEGRELHVGVWGNDPPEILPPIEFDFSDLPPEYPPIISYAAKWDPLSEVFHRVHTECPAQLSKRALEKVEAVAVRAYQVTGCRDYARLDIRFNHNNPYVLEVNPNPDLTEGVSFMDEAEVAGYTFGEALARIVGFALERKAEMAAEVAAPEAPVEPAAPPAEPPGESEG